MSNSGSKHAWEASGAAPLQLDAWYSSLRSYVVLTLKKMSQRGCNSILANGTPLGYCSACYRMEPSDDYFSILTSSSASYLRVVRARPIIRRVEAI